ncbi:MAG: hypothetical protein COV75_06865 [Candidatus Omnitrophica bacterium CG11_big_fil_rev_8_21_14_0_20_63_9]|nr:MAG: hypothetical protein COV75_06865 [Candidatus Omnitrophica bacterium CG11_big_fil_rev_8_21_14_0_20_63_9]
MALLGLVIGSSAAWAEQGRPLSGSMMTSSGTIASIDAQSKTLRLKTGPVSWKNFQLDQEARITSGLRKLELNDLAPGTEVRVEYQQEGNRQIAHRVDVMRPSGSNTPASSKLEAPSEPAPRTQPE